MLCVSLHKNRKKQHFLLNFSACDEWRLLPKPDLHRDVNRFGHSAVVSNGWAYFLVSRSNPHQTDGLVRRPFCGFGLIGLPLFHTLSFFVYFFLSGPCMYLEAFLACCSTTCSFTDPRAARPFPQRRVAWKLDLGFAACGAKATVSPGNPAWLMEASILPHSAPLKLVRLIFVVVGGYSFFSPSHFNVKILFEIIRILTTCTIFFYCFYLYFFVCVYF